MTCPACQKPLNAGAYCADGHPLRRARRLTGDERSAAQREAERRREAERDRAERRRRVRPCFATAWDRQWLHRRGELAEALREAVSCGFYTSEDAARLEAETAAEVAAMGAGKARRLAEYEKTREVPAGFVAPFRYDGHGYIFDAAGEVAADNRSAVHSRWRPRGWGRIGYLSDAEAVMDAWTAWVAEAVGDGQPDGEEVTRRMNAKAGRVEMERERGEVFTGRGVGPEADWRWVTDGAYCYSGQPGEHPVKAGQIVRGVRPVFGEAERVDPPEPRRRSSHRRAIGIVALAGALMGVGGLGNDRR